MVNDLAKDPEKKIRILSATWEGIKKAIDEFEDWDDIINDYIEI